MVHSVKITVAIVYTDSVDGKPETGRTSTQYYRWFQAGGNVAAGRVQCAARPRRLNMQPVATGF